MGVKSFIFLLLTALNLPRTQLHSGGYVPSLVSAFALLKTKIFAFTGVVSFDFSAFALLKGKILAPISRKFPFSIKRKVFTISMKAGDGN